jgi:subtilisin family serine protease
VSDLEAVGFAPRSVIEHPTEHYKMVTGSVPVTRLEDLAAIDHVVVVEGPQRMHPLLDYSVPQIHADTLRNGTPARKGAGVVIGIIDTGIDWRHKAFVDPATGASRILAIWDQRKALESGEHRAAAPFNVFGVEYLNNEITSSLQPNAANRIRARDGDTEDGHGTHVAGIAAGNGVPATCCHGGSTYIGVAPGASLIVVRYSGVGELGENVRVTDALNYIFTHPLAVGKPIVVNISLGGNLGPHDGTSALERTIDAITAMGPGKVIVVAAGNHASLDSNDSETLCHVKASVPTGQTDIEFKIRSGYEDDGILDLWYDRAGSINLEVIADGGATSGIINHGTAHASFTANPGASADALVTVDIAGAINGPYGRDNNFRVRINKPLHSNIPKGDWKLRLRNPNPGPVNLHCWIERGENQPTFLGPLSPADSQIRASSDSTLSIPSTAAGAISVANHQSKTSCCDCCPSNDIEPSSGRGPVARNAAANHKPDIAAPGLQISSTQADVANFIGNCCQCCPDGCCCLYHDLTGTSMSAPHVTGTVALMLEANPNLTKADVLNYLQHSAQPAPAGGTPEAWGAGKLDALAAVNAVLAAGGGGGGGGHIVRESTEPALAPRPAGHPPRDGGKIFMADAPPPPSRELWIQQIRARVEELPNGVALAASISRHFSEVRRLINHNRRIATMWHRTSGPRLLRFMFQCSCQTQGPSVVVTERHKIYFDRWCQLLTLYGSKQLKQSLEQHRAAIWGLVDRQAESTPADAEAVSL